MMGETTSSSALVDLEAKYQINIENARGIAIGNGARVEIRSDSPVFDGTSDPDREWNIAVVRELLTVAFDDLELTDLCADHFGAVAERFTRTMEKRQLVQNLLDYCIRHEQIAHLIALVQERNPAQYKRFAPMLGSYLGAITSDPTPAGPGSTVVEAPTPPATDASSSTTDMSAAGTDLVAAADSPSLNAAVLEGPHKTLPWPLRILRTIFWMFPLSLGRVAQRLGAKVDDVAAWLIGALLIFALILMALGWITGGEIWAVITKALGL